DGFVAVQVHGPRMAAKRGDASSAGGRERPATPEPVAIADEQRNPRTVTLAGADPVARVRTSSRLKPLHGAMGGRGSWRAIMRGMNDTIPTIRLRNAWRGSHPWIFQKLVDKPAQRPRPGSIVDVVGVDGTWIGRGFYNGHSRIALRMLEADPGVAVDAAWFAHR